MGIMEFLDYMDATRDIRIMGRPDVNQMYGYRNEWNDYVETWVEDNSDWN